MGNAAAKEPTMEDILSSIRKIIAEEGDAPEDIAMAQAGSSPAPKVVPEPQIQEAEARDTEVHEPVPVAGSLAQIAAGLQSDETTTDEPFRPLDADAPAVEEVPVEAAETSSRSLADIAAAVKAMENTGGAQPPAEVAEVPAEQPVEHYEPELAPQPVAAEPKPAPVEPQVSEQEATYVEMSEAIAAPVAQADALEHDLDYAAHSEEAAFKGALMSPGSDVAVSGSFERLKRSMMDDLDAKTESIMRPLLREWLDENLPTMVERLVREEIERVARG